MTQSQVRQEDRESKANNADDFRVPGEIKIVAPRMRPQLRYDLSPMAYRLTRKGLDVPRGLIFADLDTGIMNSTLTGNE
jgi:hypothetical protein